MAADTVCQTCGAIGYAELLVFCSKCKTSAEHRYCVFNLSKSQGGDEIWSCEKCDPTFSISSFDCKHKSRVKLKKHGMNKLPQVNRVGGQSYVKVSTKKLQNPCEAKEHTGNFFEVEADTTHKSILAHGKCNDFSKSVTCNDHVSSEEAKNLESEAIAVNDQLQFKETSASFVDWLGGDAKCNPSVGCQIDVKKSLQDQSPTKVIPGGISSSSASDPHHIRNRVVQGPKLDVCPSSKTLKPILNPSVIKMKRRRVVLDDEQLDNEGNDVGYLDVKDGVDAHPAKVIPGDISSNSASDPYHIRNGVVQGPKFDVCQSSKTLKSILKSSVTKMKRRRVVLDDDEQLDNEGSDDYLDLKEGVDTHPACKPHEEKTLKRKRKLILNDDDLNEVYAPAKNGEVGFIKFSSPQFSKSGDSVSKISGEMKSRKCLVQDYEYSSEEDRYKPSVDEVSDIRQGTELSADLCFVKEDCHSSSSIVDTTSSISESQSIPSASSVENLIDFPALPLLDYAWRGCFDVCSEMFLPVVAHLSSKACERVCQGSKMLPSIVFLDKKSTFQSQPDSFRQSGPTADNVALYFFPYNDSVRMVYDHLLGLAIVQRIMFKAVLDYAELLIFPSTELPSGCQQRFDGRYYFWGVFRRKQDPILYRAPVSIANHEENRVVRPLCINSEKKMRA